jgi:DNA (cytosine-5)-methyltransferase 1
LKKVTQKIKVVDLYSGCGGMSLGFQNAGFEIVSAYDNWQPAVDVYRRNFKHPIHKKDLSDLSILKELKSFNADIIIGGPPCQDFSIAGHRNFNGHRANLTVVYSKIVTHILPKWFVMENVYNIEKSPVLEEVLKNFKKAGYGITKGIFDASLMGVPQTRKRYFVIGKLKSTDNFLEDNLQNSLSKKRMTVKDYLGDTLNTEFYYMHPRSYNRRAIFSIEEPSSTIRGVNRPIPETYTPHSADKSKNIKKVRPLTSKERSYIQTFPNEFEFSGTKSAIEQMIGNAVPVKMAEFIARHIYSNFN